MRIACSEQVRIAAGGDDGDAHRNVDGSQMHEIMFANADSFAFIFKCTCIVAQFRF
jgi:hypothetical protein